MNGRPAAARRGRTAVLLGTPVVTVFAVLYLLPLLMTVRESLKVHVPGRIGGVAGTFTLANYAELLDPVYVRFFLDTFRISLVAAVLALAAGYPVAYFAARRRAGTLRTALIATLVSMLFLGAIVRVYSLLLTLGPVGLLHPLVSLLGIAPNSVTLIEVTVTLGLMHSLIPIVALTLMGTISNVDPRLEDAAQSLGAARWWAFLSITTPLSLRGLVSSFLLAYAIAISSFVVPMVLGKGIVSFATNLVYERFSEVANFPSGAAIAVVMLVLSIAIVYGLLRVVMRRFGVA